MRLRKDEWDLILAALLYFATSPKSSPELTHMARGIIIQIEEEVN